MVERFASWLLRTAIEAYRLSLGLALPDSCRYQPSCSVYALEAIHVHGPRAGLMLAARRILRCHPFRPGGYDPVPSELPKKA